MAIPDDALDTLYHGPLEEFTSARNELAKRLRAAFGSYVERTHLRR